MTTEKRFVLRRASERKIRGVAVPNVQLVESIRT